MKPAPPPPPPDDLEPGDGDRPIAFPRNGDLRAMWTLAVLTFLGVVLFGVFLGTLLCSL